jgi:hypothetical protein
MGRPETATGYAGSPVLYKEGALSSLSRLQKSGISGTGKIGAGDVQASRYVTPYTKEPNEGYFDSLGRFVSPIVAPALTIDDRAISPNPYDAPIQGNPYETGYGTYAYNALPPGSVPPMPVGGGSFAVGDGLAQPGLPANLVKALASRYPDVSTADYRNEADWFDDVLQRYVQDQYDVYQSNVQGVRGEYNDRLAKLRDELAGYQGARPQINEAYDKYRANSGAALQAAIIDAAPLPPSGVAGEMEKVWDHYDGEMSETLKRIDSSGSPELAEAMSNEVRHMETVLVDGVRSGLLSQNEMHELASAEARALANMAHKDNAYQAEVARFKLELQIRQAIADKEDQIDSTVDDMNKALFEVQKNFGDFTLGPDEMWGRAMSDYFEQARGLDGLEAANMTNLWKQLMDTNPAAFHNYNEFKGELFYHLNMANAQKLGQTEQILTQIERERQASLDSGASTPYSRTEELYRTQMIAPKGYGQYGKDGIPQDILDSLFDIADPAFDAILDLWKHHQDFQNNYSSYEVTPALPSGYGASGQAPNNAALKNTPVYRYRREVTAPHYADLITSLFPGTEIGGLGYIRPASDVGGGKSSNSDHQSGGAIDVYFKNVSPEESDQKLRQVANWARSYPEIFSLVVYEGNSSHQKIGSDSGHVHLSFNLAHQVPGSHFTGDGHDHSTSGATSQVPQ